MKLTRRKLAVAMLGPAAALGQGSPPQPRNAEEELAAARENAKRNAGELAKVRIPMATEPAFRFKA